MRVLFLISILSVFGPGFSAVFADEALDKRIVLAARQGNIDEIANALSDGAPIDAVFDNESPLYAGASTLNFEVCEFLIKRLANVNLKMANGETPLLAALLSGMKAPENESVFSVVELLVRSGANINAQVEKSANGMFFKGDHALLLAVQLSNERVPALLIEEGAKLNSDNIYGLSPIHFVIQAKKHSILKAMFAQGRKKLEVDKLDLDGNTPIMAAALLEDIDALNVFYNNRHGFRFDLRVKNHSKKTVMDIARKATNIRVFHIVNYLRTQF